MLKKFFNYFLSGYSGLSIEIQKKVRLFIIMDFVCLTLPVAALSSLWFKIDIPLLDFVSIGLACVYAIGSLILIKKMRYHLNSILAIIVYQVAISLMCLSYEAHNDMASLYIYMIGSVIVAMIICIISTSKYHIFVFYVLELVLGMVIAQYKFDNFLLLFGNLPFMDKMIIVSFTIAGNFCTYLVLSLNKSIVTIAEEKAAILSDIFAKSKEIVINLNSGIKEIEAAAQQQTSGAGEHASGITEVSATLSELSITARQITKSVGELVLSSEEIIKTLHENEGQLLNTVTQLEEVGTMSRKNADELGELGKRSRLINEMVDIIKEVANKTNILSINASIEASRHAEAGSGFSVVAAEIRELSKETLTSAKSVEQAATDIRDLIQSIIASSKDESGKIIESGAVMKKIYKDVEDSIAKINNNYTFTQKIDTSIKQQESGSKQSADTMTMMAEISRQSAETARQTLSAVQDIVGLIQTLDDTVKQNQAGE